MSQVARFGPWVSGRVRKAGAGWGERGGVQKLSMSAERANLSTVGSAGDNVPVIRRLQRRLQHVTGENARLSVVVSP